MEVAATPLVVTHPASLKHDTGAHPERIARIEAIEAMFASRPEVNFNRLEARQATREELLRVHSEAHVELIEAAAERGGAMIDSETIVSAGSYEAALRSAGGAAMLVDQLLAAQEGGTVPRGFSIQRPPGHHAVAERAMGFCLFNNVAVATAHAQGAHGVERVAILDWDVHHGNGTNDIFYTDPSVLFCSIHEYPLYPGTGSTAEQGEGAGVGFTLNLPVPGGSGDDEFLTQIEQRFVPRALGFQPQLLLVSAGFDAHARDPLASCTVTTEGFAAMTASVLRLANELEIPLGLVLEGGYDLEGLVESVGAVVKALGEAGG